MRTGRIDRGFVIHAGESVPGFAPDVKASAGVTGGSLTVMTLTVDGGPPRHTHTREDESIFLFTGELSVECGGDEFRAEAGSLVFLPRGVPHAFYSVKGRATGLLIVTPGGIEEYFAQLHAAETAEQVDAVMAAYGIVRS